MGEDRRRYDTRRRSAAERLISAVLADEDLVVFVSEAYVEEQISKGVLLRTADLRAGQHEFQPAGLRARLEAAIDEALDLLDNGKVREAMDVLESTIPGVGDSGGYDPDIVDAVVIEDDDEDEEGPAEPVGAAPPGSPQLNAGDPEPEPEPHGERRRHRPVREPDEDDEPEVGPRPVELPRLDRTYECKGVMADGNIPCGAQVDGQQAQWSFTRFRAELCKTCMAGYNSATGLVDAS